MLGYNGGLRGKPRIPSISNASGIWDLDEQKIAASAGIWPSAGGDPYWANVSLLLHMNGSNGSTTFTDSSSNAFSVTANGNAQISTAQSKFDGSSGYFDGSNSYLTIPTNPNLLPGVADFTLEDWVYVSGNNNSGNTTNKTLFGTSWSGSTPSGSFLLMLDGADNNRVLFLGWNTLALYSTTTLSTGQWYHLAVTNVSGTFRLFVNGVQEDSGTSSLNLNNNTSPIYIGRYVDPGQFNGFFNGYIDDLRITKGVARYTSDFTPPTAPFPNF
jgi:hypothetical protein